jgi:hypothetical protein
MIKNNLIEKFEVVSEPDAVIKVECIHLTEAGRKAFTVDARIPARGEEILPKITRVWAMPSANTFSIKPIRSLVKWYLSKSKISVDPFARNNRWATYTNDLNPETKADSHLEAKEFLRGLVEQKIKADLVLFDPPYSLRQVKECYQGIGIDKIPVAETHGWTTERDLIAEILSPGGICMSFGWNSQGIGIKRGFQIVEILLVNHGREHNDTIVTVERKQPQGIGLF